MLEGSPRRRVAGDLGIRYATRNGDAHARVGSVGDHRLEHRGVDGDRLVVLRAVVRRERLPPLHGGIPRVPLGHVTPAVQVFEGRVVGRDEAGTGPCLDRHVADRHALLHGQRADRLAAVFEDMAGAAAHPDAGDQRQDDVLRRDAGAEPSIDPYLVGPRPTLEQALGGQDHLDLAGSDPEGQRTEGSMRAGVAVAADDRHARLGQPELRADDVHDALVRTPQAVQRNAELPAVRGQLVDLGRGELVEDRQAARVSWDAVVGRGDGPLGMAHLEPALPQTGERLGTGDLMNEVEVDREHRRGLRILADEMVDPDLLEQRSRAGAHGPARLAQAPARIGRATRPDFASAGIAPRQCERRRVVGIHPRFALEVGPEFVRRRASSGGRDREGPGPVVGRARIRAD